MEAGVGGRAPDGAGTSVRVGGMGGPCLLCALKREREGLYAEDCWAFCKHPPDWKATLVCVSVAGSPLCWGLSSEPGYPRRSNAPFCSLGHVGHSPASLVLSSVPQLAFVSSGPSGLSEPEFCVHFLLYICRWPFQLSFLLLSRSLFSTWWAWRLS